MKQDLESKIKEALKEEFVGNYLFSEEEENSILDEASRIFRRICYEYGETLSCADYDLIFVSLIISTKRWNPDKYTFLDNIYQHLLGHRSTEELPTKKAYNEIRKLVDNFEILKKVFVFSCFKKKYYASIIGHAFAPIDSITSFIDFCWEIYNEDLDQNYVNNDPVLTLLVSSMQNRFGTKDMDNEDTVQLGSKVYKLRAGIKGLIISYPDLLKKLFNDVLIGINSKFNSIPYRPDNYLKSLITNWWNKKEENFGNEIRVRKSRSQNVAVSYSQIKAKYILGDDGIFVSIPPIRLAENLDYNPVITIENNGNIVKQEDLLTCGSGIIMTTQPKEYLLKDLLSDKNINLTIRITHCDKTIYDSKGNLNRDFILFSGKREVTSDECLPGSYFLYTRQFNLINNRPSNIGNAGLSNILNINAIEGERLQTINRTIFFVTENSNRDVYLIAQTQSEIKYVLNGEEYKVIDGELYLDISKKIKPSSLGLRINKIVFNLTDFSFTELDGKFRYEVGSLCDAGETQKLNVFKFSDYSIVCAANVIKFNNISLTFDKDIYYGDEVGTAEFVTNKYHLNATFNTTDYELSIPFNDGEIIVCPPILKWKLNEGNWHSQQRANDIWYKSIYNNGTILEIDIPKGKEYKICLLNQEIPSESNNAFKIGEYIYSFDSIKNKEVPLFIRCDNKCYLIDRLHYKETFLEDPIRVNSLEKSIHWDPKFFVGEKNTQFNIRISFNDKVIYDAKLSSSAKSYVMNLEDERYQIEVISLKRNLFKHEANILFSKCFVLGNEKKIKYKNKRVVINRVMYFGRTEFSEIKTLYIDNIEYLGEVENAATYSGRLCLYNRDLGKFIPLDYMYNEKSEKTKVNPIRLQKKTESTAYIGYGLDLEDEGFEYDNEFTIEPNRRLSVAAKKNGVRCLHIDYFELEVEKNV